MYVCIQGYIYVCVCAGVFFDFLGGKRESWAGLGWEFSFDQGGVPLISSVSMSTEAISMTYSSDLNK